MKVLIISPRFFLYKPKAMQEKYSNLQQKYSTEVNSLQTKNAQSQKMLDALEQEKNQLAKSVADKSDELGDRALIIIQGRDPTRICIRGFASYTTEDKLRTHFKDVGAINKVEFVRYRDRGRNDSAFFDFETEEQANKAVQKSGSELYGKILTVQHVSTRTGGGDHTSVFIGNLSNTTTEAQLRTYFERADSIKAIRLTTDISGQATPLFIPLF